MKKAIYRKNSTSNDKDALLMCQICGRLHYVSPLNYQAHYCRGCQTKTPHLSVPEEFKSPSRKWYIGPKRVPSEYLP